MRIAVVIAASVLVAGCSQALNGDAAQSEPMPTLSPTPRTSSSVPPGTTTSAVPSRAPAPGAAIGAVVDWIEAGAPADAAGYHSATRDGATTPLGEDVAFTTPSGKTQCMTDTRFDGALACLVELTEPPPRPADVYGEWKGGWVDFAGPTLEVGSAHGDPGRFSSGTGPELAYDQALTFGDYRCRADQTGLFCVNYAHQSAARFDDAGIEPFGCLRQVEPPAGIGEKFSC